MILLSAGLVEIAASLASKWTSLQRLLKWYQNQGNSHITHLSTALETIWYFDEYISNYMCKNGELSLHSFVVIGHRSWNKTQDFIKNKACIYLQSTQLNYTSNNKYIWNYTTNKKGLPYYILGCYKSSICSIKTYHTNFMWKLICVRHKF